MQNRYKHVFVDATMLFELPYIQIWMLCQTVVNGFEPVPSPLKYVYVSTEQTYVYEKPIEIKLDMCDANVQSISFKSQRINIVLKS